MKKIIIIAITILIFTCDNNTNKESQKIYIYTFNENEYISYNPHTHGLLFIDNQVFWWLALHDQNGTFIIYNGKKGPYFDSLKIDSITLAKNGKKLVYYAYKGDKKHIVVSDYQGNTQVSSGFDMIFDLLISNNCEKVIYYGFNNLEYFFMNNGEYSSLGENSTVSCMQMSLDGSNIYYEIDMENISKKILNDRILNRIDGENLDTVVLSPYKAIAYLSKKSNIRDSMFLSVNKKNKSLSFYDVAAKSIVFSPGDTHFAYAAYAQKGILSIYLDNRSYDEHNFTGNLKDIVFSGDGKRLAYIISDNILDLVVVDGEVIGSYKNVISRVDGKNVTNFIFSDNGFHYAFIATINDKSWVLIDNQMQGKGYDFAIDLVLNPQGTDYAVQALDKGNKFFIYNGQEIFKEVKEYLFSKDGRQIAYIAREENQYSLYLDNEKKCTASYLGSLVNKANGGLAYLVNTDKELFIEVISGF